METPTTVDQLVAEIARRVSNATCFALTDVAGVEMNLRYARDYLRDLKKALEQPVIGVTWNDIDVVQPEEGQRVTLYFVHGQIRDAVRAKDFAGGFKLANCRGWECAGSNWGSLWTATTLSLPNTDVQRRSGELPTGSSVGQPHENQPSPERSL